MSITNIISRLLRGDRGGIKIREYDCEECGNNFESAKQPERAQCMECLSNDLEVVRTFTRS